MLTHLIMELHTVLMMEMSDRFILDQEHWTLRPVNYSIVDKEALASLLVFLELRSSPIICMEESSF